MNRILIGLAITVALFVGFFGSQLAPRFAIQGQHSILFVLATSILLVAIVVVIYLRRELHRQATRHKARREEYGYSDKVRSLTTDQAAVFSRRVMKNLDQADRKRLVFEIMQNTLLVFAGLLPMLSTIVDSNETQKLLSFGASFSAFIVGLFSMSKFTVEHRRTGFLIEKALNAWLVEGGEFRDMTPGNAFRELVSQVQTILDTNETSFVGAGSVLPPAGMFEDEPTEGYTVASSDDITPSRTPTSQADQTPASTGRISPAVAEAPRSFETVVPETVAIAPENFGAWQAAALAADDYAEITQEGV